MQIRYTLSPDDLWCYNKFVVRRTPAFILVYVTRILSVPVMTLLFLWNLHVSNLLSLVATLGMACVWVPFCLWSGRRSYLKANQQRPDMLGLQTLDLTAEGVRQTTVNTETVMKWAIFSEVLETPQQILFFISRRHAIVVPKHAFSSQAEVASFFEAARAYKSGEAVVTAELPNVWPPPPRIME